MRTPRDNFWPTEACTRSSRTYDVALDTLKNAISNVLGGKRVCSALVDVRYEPTADILLRQPDKAFCNFRNLFFDNARMLLRIKTVAVNMYDV